MLRIGQLDRDGRFVAMTLLYSWEAFVAAAEFCEENHCTLE